MPARLFNICQRDVNIRTIISSSFNLGDIAVVSGMDPPDAFLATLFRWDPRGAGPGASPLPHQLLEAMAAPQTCGTCTRTQRDVGGLDVLFQTYGIRYYTAAKIAELGFTVNTLLDMKDEQLDEMMTSLSQIFRWDLLVGETYGIKAALRAERRRRLLPSYPINALDTLSQEGLSKEPVMQHKREKQHRQRQKKRAASTKSTTYSTIRVEEEEEEEDEDDEEKKGRVVERQREHPFVVTEPGEVARGKKNGIDYLFHLYEQCREFLIHVQNIAMDRGEKFLTKVTNQVFRYAKNAGASYINKPKMRHYVHCYALHCLDEETSNALRKAFKQKGENVGPWRQACYQPLVTIASHHGWDINSIFNSHPRLSIWYVPTKLRQLCHANHCEANANADATAASAGASTVTTAKSLIKS